MDLKKFEQWQRVQNKADDLREVIVDYLYMAWKDYCELDMNTSNDRWPDDIQSIERYCESIHISGTWSGRGCTDRVYCSMPVSFAFGDEEERKKVLQKYREDVAKLSEKIKQKKEEQERETYLKLKDKFENT